MTTMKKMRKRARRDYKLIKAAIKRNPEMTRVELGKHIDLEPSRISSIIHRHDKKKRSFEEMRKDTIIKLVKENQRLKSNNGS